MPCTNSVVCSPAGSNAWRMARNEPDWIPVTGLPAISRGKVCSMTGSAAKLGMLKLGMPKLGMLMLGIAMLGAGGRLDRGPPVVVGDRKSVVEGKSGGGGG